MTEQEARTLKSQIESEFPRLEVAVRSPQNTNYENMWYCAVRARATNFFSCQVLNSPADWEQLKEVTAIIAVQPATAR